MEKLIEKYSKLMPRKLIDDIIKYLPEKTSPKKVEEIFEVVYKEYSSSLAEPGTSVGIIGSESIGEPSTQMTLNTFHLAGVAEVNITTGLPRLIEILDGRKNISTATLDIYLKEPYNNGEEITKIAAQIRETNLTTYVDEMDIDIATSTLKVVLNAKKLDDAKVDLKSLNKNFDKNFKNYKIKIEENILYLTSAKEGNINELYKLKEKVKEVYVNGIKGITQVVPVKTSSGEFIIKTAGSNLKEVLKLEFVDGFKTNSNDVFEIEKLYGIEAARALIINQIRDVLEEQGVALDARHVLLVADTMCMSGHVLGINRYGIVKEKPSVLARISFETPLKHLIAASLSGEVDELHSVIENVMLNQPIPVGTGLPHLITRILKGDEKLPKKELDV